MPIATLWQVTLRTVQDWWKDNCLRLAASLAYYTALSLAPLVLLLVGVVGLVLDRQQVAHQLTAQLESLMGTAGRELVTSILTTASPQGGALATIIGLATLFIGATAVFGELQATLNLIWEVQPAPTSGVWAGLWAWLRDASSRWPLSLRSRSYSLSRSSSALPWRVPLPCFTARSRRSSVVCWNSPFRSSSSPSSLPYSISMCQMLRSAGVTSGRAGSSRRSLYTRQDGHRLLPWAGERGLGLRRGGLDGGAARVGLLFSSDHVLWRRVHPCLGHTSWRCDT